MRRIIMSFVSLAVVVGAAFGLTFITPLRRPPAAAVDLPRTTEQVCPTSGTVLSVGEGDLTHAAIGGAPVTARATGSFQAEAPVQLRGEAPLVAGVVGSGTPQTYAACASPATEAVLLVADPATTELSLINSDTGEAAVDLTLLGPEGELTPVGARGIAIAPGVTRKVALSVLAPAGPVGVLVTASQGRVAATLVNVEGRPATVAVAADTATDHVIPAVPAAADAARLLLTNPAENRLEVSVEALGTGGRYVPAGASDISLPAMSTVAVDLTGALSGEATTILVHADAPIGAAVLTRTGSGAPATLTAREPSARLGVATPGSGSLLLSNPQAAPAAVQVVFADAPAIEVTAPAGATTAVAVPEGESVLVAVVADRDIVAAVAVPATGIVVPLARNEVEPQDPGTVQLDPGLR